MPICCQAASLRYYKYMPHVKCPNILWVEPDLQLSVLYQRAAKAGGLKTQIAHSADDALAQIEKCKPHLILLEVQLAGHNGIELLQEIKSYPDWQNIPVIFVTVVPGAELGLTKQIMNQLVIRGYFYKPTLKLPLLLNAIYAELEVSA